jgi:hypothetical protein
MVLREVKNIQSTGNARQRHETTSTACTSTFVNGCRRNVLVNGEAWGSMAQAV